VTPGEPFGPIGRHGTGKMQPMMLWMTVAVTLAAAFAASAAPDVENKNREFDYFLFVRQWDPSMCMTHRCTRQISDREFTIHGLWPEREDGSYPSYCNSTEHFHENSIKDLIPNLEDKWRSLYGSDTGFWAHEWSKHGTCCMPVINSERSYFEISLHLYQSFDIMQSLSSSDIVPSATKEYDYSDFSEAIKSGLGTDVILHCKSKNLEEVWMCISKDLQPIDCPKAKELSNSCEKIVLPPFKEESTSPSSAAGDGNDDGGYAKNADCQKYLLARLVITAPSLLLIIVIAVVVAVVIKKKQECKDGKKTTGIVHKSEALEDPEKEPLISKS